MHQLNQLRISVIPTLGRLGKKDEIYGQSWLPRETPLEEKHKPLYQKPEIPAQDAEAEQKVKVNLDSSGCSTQSYRGEKKTHTGVHTHAR